MVCEWNILYEGIKRHMDHIKHCYHMTSNDFSWFSVYNRSLFLIKNAKNIIFSKQNKAVKIREIVAL